MLESRPSCCSGSNPCRLLFCLTDRHHVENIVWNPPQSTRLAGTHLGKGVYKLWHSKGPPVVLGDHISTCSLSFLPLAREFESLAGGLDWNLPPSSETCHKGLWFWLCCVGLIPPWSTCHPVVCLSVVYNSSINFLRLSAFDSQNLRASEMVQW